MHCLVVTAHPLEDSLCKHLTAKTRQYLEAVGHTVTIENLYAQAFDPVLKVDERQSYYKNAYDTAMIADYAARLQSADALVLIFPTWWFGFPAILKGWFDRVWGPGVAFDHADNFGPITPRLAKLKRVLVVTTLGSPCWIDWIIMRRPVRRIVKTALMSACTRQAKLDFLSLYAVENADPARIKRFTAKITARIDRLPR